MYIVTNPVSVPNTLEMTSTSQDRTPSPLSFPFHFLLLLSWVLFSPSYRPLTSLKSSSGQDEEDIKPYIADLKEKERLVVHVRRVTEEVNFEKEEIIVICDSCSESENGDGIEMLRVMPTDIDDLEHAAAAFNSYGGEIFF